MDNIMIAWIDITYNKPIKTLFGKRKCTQILNRISGHFATNTLNAIMGPSGAGKTTLLKCLSRRIIHDQNDGSQIMVSKTMYRTAFITQNIFEHLIEGLTVRQTILYASKLKNGRTDLNHKQIVSDLMTELLITDTADNRVESCSGGEQKRVVIATELTPLIKPNVLFIDEPTSGLDSNAADVLIACLQSLAHSHHMSIITTIHQPNSELLQMFDKIYVLAKGGLNVYSGPDHHLRQHLDDCQIECHSNQVPIEVLLKISSEETKSESISRLVEKTNEENEFLSEKCLAQNMRSLKSNPSKRFSFKDLNQLLCRTMIYTYKCQRMTFILQFVTIELIAFLMRMHSNTQMIKPGGCLDMSPGLGCNQTLTEIMDEQYIKENVKYLLLLINSISCVSIIVISITFCADFKIFRNEQQNGWYSTGSFLFAKTIVDFFPQILIIALFCIISDHYHDIYIFVVFYSVNLLIFLCNQSVSQISAVISPNNPKLSFMIAFSLNLAMLFLSNSIIPLKELNYSLQYLSSISYVKSGFESIVLIIYGFDRCPNDQISSVLLNYDIATEDFLPNIINLFIVCSVFKFATLLVLFIKIDNSFDGKHTDNDCQVIKPKDQDLAYSLHLQGVIL